LLRPNPSRKNHKYLRFPIRTARRPRPASISTTVFMTSRKAAERSFAQLRSDQPGKPASSLLFSSPAAELNSNDMIFTRAGSAGALSRSAHRNLALPLSRYPKLSGFTEANNAYIDVAVDLGEQAIRSALADAGIEPYEVDTIVVVSSTGIAVPTIDARLMSRISLRPDIKRVPLFGLGCVAGAAGMARVHDYLRGYPDDVAVLLSVELCSLTLQRDDPSIPALIGVSHFGDGAVAVVATGADWTDHRNALSPNAYHGPRILATQSRVIPDTVDVMGWNVGSSGFQLVLSKDVPKMGARRFAPHARRVAGRRIVRRNACDGSRLQLRATAVALVRGETRCSITCSFSPSASSAWSS
jgi:Chalcone and stilbene synthases, N-terminal domain